MKLLLVLVAISVISAAILDNASFTPPFNDVDGSGGRLINSHWRHSGETSVMQNFVRITPDRQSKKGSMWMKSKIGTDSIATTGK